MRAEKTPQAVLLIGLVAIVIVAALIASEKDGRSAGAEEAQASTKPDPARFADSFRVLRDGTDAGDDWRSLFSERMAAELGLDPELASSGRTPQGEEAAVIPGVNGICIASPTAGSCAREAGALAGGLVAVEFCTPDLAVGSSRITALVPDSVPEISIETTEGQTHVIPVPDSVLYREIEGIPATLTASQLPGPIQLPQSDEGLFCG